MRPQKLSPKEVDTAYASWGQTPTWDNARKALKAALRGEWDDIKTFLSLASREERSEVLKKTAPRLLAIAIDSGSLDGLRAVLESGVAGEVRHARVAMDWVRRAKGNVDRLETVRSESIAWYFVRHVDWWPSEDVVDAVRLLEAAGASFDEDRVEDDYLETPFTWAIDSGDVELTKALIDVGSTSFPVNDVRTHPLYIARNLRSDSRKRVLRLLFDKLQDLFYDNIAGSGFNVLEFAAVMRYDDTNWAEYVAELIDVGVDPLRVRRHDRPCALQLALKHGGRVGKAIATRTMTRGELPAESVENSDDLDSALIKAAIDRHSKRIAQLLNDGVDVDARDKDGTTALMWSCFLGDREAVRLLLDRGADTDVVNEHGMTALEMAMTCQEPSRIGIIELLLNHGADVDARNSEGATPLSSQCRSDSDFYVARLLLDHGADVDARDDSGRTALMNVFCKNAAHKSRLVALLLDYGADVEARDTDGRTALFFAVESSSRECYEIVLQLLNHGADPFSALDAVREKKDGRLSALFRARSKTRMRSGELPREAVSGEKTDEEQERLNAELLKSAFWQLDEDFFKLLKLGADPNVKDKSKTPVLCSMSRFVDEESMYYVKALLEAGADPNVRDKFSHAPLHTARGPNTTALLLKAGADPRVKDKSGRTPLHRIANKNKKRVALLAKLLVDAGADVNALDRYGKTPLTLAVETKNDDAVSALIAVGADLETRDSNGQTVLHVAAAHGFWEIAQKLLKAGADPNARDTDGDTPLLLGFENYSIASNLLKAGADPFLVGSCGKSAIDLVKDKREESGVKQLLIKYGLKRMGTTGSLPAECFSGGSSKNEKNDGRAPLDTAPRFLSREGWEIYSGGAVRERERALLYAIDRGNRTKVVELLDSGTSVSSGSPLVRAAKADDVEIVRTLLRYHADPDQRDADGNTALYAAATPQIVYALIEGGARTSETNSNGDTVLSAFASDHGSVDRLKAALRASGGRWIDEMNRRDGTRALHRAAENDVPEAVSALHEYGADVEARDYYGRTPLHRAALIAAAAAALALVESGADVFATDDDGKTPCQIATDEHGSGSEIGDTLKTAAENKMVSHDLPSESTGAARRVLPSFARRLFDAVDKEDAKAVKKLLRRHPKADVALAAEQSHIVIQAAGANDDLAAREMIFDLVSRGADPNEKSTHGYALTQCSTEAAERALLEAGADPNAKHNGKPVMFDFVVAGNSRTLEFAIEKGGDPNCVYDRDGVSILHVAAINTKLEATKTLLAHGADVHARGGIKQQTPLHWSVALKTSLTKQRDEIVSLLLDAGADPLARDIDGATPLQYAEGTAARLMGLAVIQKMGSTNDLPSE